MASVAIVKQDIHNESCIGKLLKINAFVIYCTFLLHSCILQNLTLSLRWYFATLSLLGGGGGCIDPLFNFANQLSIDLKLCMHIENLVIISSR